MAKGKYADPSKRNRRVKKTSQGMGRGTKTGGKHVSKYHGQGGRKR